ncbi:MAG TPA: hypothetical protein VNU26_03665 [Mycobacteriales bacterium]|nr:hypothetical protein [Mycobacteriales bacterium]
MSDPLGDLGRAAAVWRRYPLLPVATVATASVLCLTNASDGVAVLAGLGALLLVGWPGTERLFYLRAWHGDGMRLLELPGATLRFFTRFFLLGLLSAVAYLVVALPALVEVSRRALDAARQGAAAGVTDPAQVDVDIPLWATLWLIAAVVVIDMVGTYVTPALTYSTWRVTAAIVLGLQMLRRTWPHAALYVVAPPLAVVVVNLFAQWGLATATIAVVLAALLNLLVKGAVAAYYLRVVGPVPPNGAQKPPAHPVGGWDGAPGWVDHR